MEIRWDTSNFCCNWLRSKGVPINDEKIVLDILEGQTLQKWEWLQPQQQQYKQPGKNDGQVPKVEGLLPVEFSVVFEAFYWMQTKFVTISDSLFRRSDGEEEGEGTSNAKLF